ncbi:MAG: homoserine O-succinyltransferase [Faecalibacterium sp.]|nr:homoserine O-succinyltransferase [Ruminococcus sp.]MCM1392918.1 homoserine O-succinyltransferase [Ruminococcus sp.]MCM1486158.1 homoserine O-succinyltransferase [Faecalibacterium sp.]
MPIRIDDRLPARESLESENIFVMTQSRAELQDIRPLKILILNLMPTKIDTETQLLRILGNSPLQVDIELLQTATHKATHIDETHMLTFYKNFDEIKHKKYDGMIITGAPVEQFEFEDVDYWPELCEIFEWTKTNVYSTFHICWGAQAALYYHYGIPKHELKEKMFGIFPHKPLDLRHPLLRGFDDCYNVPQSRHTETRFEDVAKCKDLQILSYSEISGIHLISDLACRKFFTTGHSEYDVDTLAKEYFRDKSKGLDIKVPHNYFPDDNPENKPIMTWRNVGTLMFTNWLNYFVYQRTPYDINSIN